MLTIFTSTHFDDALPTSEDIRFKLISTGNEDLLKVWDRPFADSISEGCICDVLPSGERYFSINAWATFKEIEPDTEWLILCEQLAMEASLRANVETLNFGDMYVSDENLPLMYSEQILKLINA